MWRIHMPRRERIIIPGACYHVCNRGLARRTIFESERDMRVFLACLVRAVKLGLIELLAYVIMATHFPVSYTHLTLPTILRV